MKITNYSSDHSYKLCFRKKQVFTLGFSLLLLANASYASDGHLSPLEPSIKSILFDKNNLLVISNSLTAQQEISGRIVNEQGEAVAGVTVKVNGTSIAASTDRNGTFRINVSANATLIITAVGYASQEKIISGSGTVQVVLKSSISDLEEVVVVGYGKQSKALVTGAVSQIGGEVLQNRSISRVSQALQGQLPGLNVFTGNSGGAPNATHSINVRGFTGLGSSGSPLIVIDGVQGGDINTLNPDDIENISVLKDAASAAIYGSSAPYGVILITTRLLHWINFKYGIDGYLHWGLNYWNDDPYKETTGINSEGGNILPAGDSWIVYPGYHKLYGSIRQEAVRDGINDYTLLQMLENKNPSLAKEIIDNMVFRFDWYDTSISHFRKMKVKILKGLEE